MDTLRILDWQARKDWAVLLGVWDAEMDFCRWGSQWKPKRVFNLYAALGEAKHRPRTAGSE